MKDKPEAIEVGLSHLRLLAQQVPCQMCRIKDMGGTSYNIEPGGGCRHYEGMPIDEVVKRLAYAVNQSNNSRELARCVNNVLSNVGELRKASDDYDETEKGE